VYSQGCINAYCGDGIVNNLAVKDGKPVNYQFIHEVCDDGLLNGTPGSLCQSDCTIEKPQTCGDGKMQSPEECDRGALNTDRDANGCRTNCRKAHCGDAIVDQGEECDAGGMNGTAGSLCNSFCQVRSFDPEDLQPSAGDPVTTIELPYLGPDGKPMTGAAPPVTANITPISTNHPPVGESGPAAIAIMAAGAAAGWAYVRRRRREI